jgi:small redox-active disulfide protein 2
MKVQIYGTGCPKCMGLEKSVKKAIEELDMDIEVEKIQDIDKIIEAGLLSTPGLAVEGEIKSIGRLPTVDEIKKWIKEKA